MQVAKAFVRTDGVHIGVDAVSGTDFVLGQSEALPLCQRMHHLCAAVAEISDGEGDGTLHSAQVIVDALALEYEEGSGHAPQPELLR